MTDQKMELFCNKQLWEDAIEHGLDKKIDKALLYALTDPKGRLAVIKAIEEGRYEIQPPKIVEIPKSNGKVRQVFANQPLDRVVLSIINAVYMSMYSDMIHPSCRSYQKGMSVQKTVREVTSKLKDGYHGYKCDLHAYFDSVNKETLFANLDAISSGSPLDNVVRKYYEDDRVVIKGEVVEHYKSLAQGCALGTTLANIVLRDIDEVLSSMDILYYRYSDDLLLIGEDADKALEVLQEMLIPKGLSLNPKKVERIHKDAEFTFLGAKIHGTEIDISDESVERFKNEIRKITKMRKGMKTKCRTTQRRAIKKINDYMYLAYMKNPNNFGWAHYFFSLCTTDKTIRELDYFVKDHIKAMYTNKWNSVTNMHKTSNDDLESMGYVSMKNRYDLFKMDRELFKADILRRN
jgi:hypothetical protein